MLFYYFAGINLVTFVLFGIDKSRARRHRYRIPERLLLGISALGGALGALLGMLFFHHKTRKTVFRIWVPGFLVFYLVLLIIFAGFRYRARPEAFKSLNSGNGISVSYATNNLILITPQDPKAGIIFYPGALIQFEAYGPLMRKCAEKGYTCAIVRMPLNLAILNVDAARDVMNYYSGISHWFLAGHSLGGAMAAAYASDHPEDFEGLVLLSAYSMEDLASCSLPVLSVYGSEDEVLDMDKYTAYETNLPDNLEEHIIEGANHAGFGYYGDQAGDGKARISRDEQIEETAALMTGLMEKHIE